MNSRRGTGLAIAGVVIAVLAFLPMGVLSRPMLVAAGVLLGLALLERQRELRRQIVVFAQDQGAVAAVIAVLATAAAAAWAGYPLYRRHVILSQLEAFSAEGRQLEQEIAGKLGRNQLMGDQTAKIQDWHERLEGWTTIELGIFYKQQLGTPQESPTYPPELPVRLRVFWDKVETDLAALDQFRSEYSRWLYR
jgi:hypothetical protein